MRAGIRVDARIRLHKLTVSIYGVCRIKTLFVLSVTLAASGSAAFAQEAYVELKGGAIFAPDLEYTFTSDTLGPIVRIDGAFETDTGYFVGAAFGYDFSGPMRIEGEAAYRDLDAEPIATIGGIADLPDPNSWAFMANSFYDFSLGGAISPYVGAGLGLAVASDFLEGEEATSLAFQIMLGAEYELTDRQSLGLEYRYFHANDFDIEVSVPGGIESLEAEHRSSGIIVSWRVSFP